MSTEILEYSVAAIVGVLALGLIAVGWALRRPLLDYFQVRLEGATNAVQLRHVDRRQGQAVNEATKDEEIKTRRAELAARAAASRAQVQAAEAAIPELTKQIVAARRQQIEAATSRQVARHRSSPSVTAARVRAWKTVAAIIRPAAGLLGALLAVAVIVVSGVTLNWANTRNHVTQPLVICTHTVGQDDWGDPSGRLLPRTGSSS